MTPVSPCRPFRPHAGPRWGVGFRLARAAAGVVLAGAVAVGAGWAQGLSAAGGAGLKAAPGLAAAVAAAATEAPRTADYIVAVVNSEPITNHEVRARLGRLREQLARSGAPAMSAAQLQQEVLEALILEKAQLQLAQELGIRVDAAQLDEAERSIALQNRLSPEELQAELSRQGLTREAFRDSLRRQLILQRLREREVEARVKVSEADVERFIQQKMDNPGADLRLNLAQILVPLPEEPSPEQLRQAMAQAQSLAARARAGADFAELARQHSAGPERLAGGAMGLRAADRYPVLFLHATRTLPVGGVAGPIRSPAGFHILKVLDKRIAGLPEPVLTQTHARHILLRPSAQLSQAQAVAELARWRTRIVGGQADFAAVARQISHDASASQGGDLGWVGPGVFVPEFEEAMNALAPMDISEPVLSRFGVHLIQVLARREVPLGEREQREQLRQLVRESKLDEAYQRWLEDVRARAYVELREPPQ